MWDRNMSIVRFSCLFLFSLIAIMSVNASFEDYYERVDVSNCTLQPDKKRMQLKLDSLIDQDNHLIKLNIKVKWNLYPQNETYPEQIQWFMTTDATGQHLLMLDDNFIAMSLGTLSYGIADMHLSFVQEPEDCLGNMTADDANKRLKFSLLTLPKTPKLVNEDGFSLLHICTGRLSSNGSCCNLSLTGTDVKCNELLEDDWMVVFTWTISFLSIIALSHFIYIIPKSVYEEKHHAFSFLDERFKIRIRLSTQQPHYNYWIEVKNLKSVLSNEFFVMLKRKLNLAKGESLNEETYNMVIDSVKRKSNELVSELSTSNGLLQNLSKTFGDICTSCKMKRYFSGDGCRKICLRAVFKIFLISLFFSPLIFRTILVYTLTSSTVKKAFVTGFLISFFLICVILSFFADGQVFKQRLRTFHKYDLEEKTKLVVSYLSKSFRRRHSWCRCLLSLIISFELLFICSLPLLLFTMIFFAKGIREKPFIDQPILICVSTVLGLTGLISIMECVLFFTQCFAYSSIGLFLNFDHIIDTIILILMILTYIVNCLSGINHKINTFNRNVIALVRELSENTRDKHIAKTIRQDKNVAMKVPKNNEQQRNNGVTLFANNNGQLCLVATGLFLFHKYEEPEHMPYLHIPKLFLDKLASKPGHLTPGLKSFLFLRAFIEIVFMLLALLAVYVVVRGFARVNDISTTVHTLVTVGSSAALIMLNKLVFTAKEYDSIDYNMYLKELIKMQSENFEDIWTDAKVDVEPNDAARFFSYNTSRCTNSCCRSPKGNSRYDIWEDNDLLVYICSDNKGNIVKSYFLKQFIQSNQY